LDIAWRNPRKAVDRLTPDHYVRLGNRLRLSKLILESVRPMSELQELAQILTHPYQVFIGPNVNDAAFTARALDILTSVNPFTPLEVVFIEPRDVPNTDRLLEAIRLKRPHFLDLELRYLFPAPGNRSVLFTLVTRRRPPRFTGDMQRQVFWWDQPKLPVLSDLQRLAELDGLLVDSPCSAAHLKAWQDLFLPQAAEYLTIGFADVSLQQRWLLLTESESFYPGAFEVTSYET
ncbi:MAG: hypothetical protein WBN03_02315, partial [Desulfobacterales bacterium]